MKDGGRSRQGRDSSRRKINRRKSGSGDRVEESNESKSDMEWQSWMCLQDREKKKGEFIMNVINS